MVKRFLLLGLIVLGLISNLKAQDFGVWVATAHRIDFPKSDGKENQLAEMKDLINLAAERGITTIYFQVRSRGDAFYQSDYEPWAESLTGLLGENPGYDPLDHFITYAKSKNIRVIGWFNVFKVADQSNQTKSKSKLKHPAEKYASWIIKSGTEKFLNPGIPEVRHYIASVAADLVSKYDLDGIQLDFCRYPTTKYNDKSTEKKYNKKHLPTGEWRRENITTTVRLIRDAVQEEKPNIILTAAPLGICKAVPNARGLESYFEVYQDSYGWLASDLIDEVEPQIYWPLGNIPDGTGAKTSPDFAALSRDWQRNSNGKVVRPGLALYKQPVAEQVDDLIEVALGNGNGGVVFYAWSQFKEQNIDLTKYKKMNSISHEISSSVEKKIKAEKLTTDQILLHNEEKEYFEYQLLDKSGSVVRSGKFGDESVLLIVIDSAAEKIVVTDHNQTIVGSLLVNQIK